METIYSSNKKTLAKKVLIDFESKVLSLKKSKIVIGLPGGSSVDFLYPNLIEKLTNLFKNNAIDFHFCFLDERLVPLTSEQSNFMHCNSKLFSTLIEAEVISDSNIFKLNYEVPSTIEAFQLFLENNEIDFAFIGTGEDAHIASVFPKIIRNDYDKDGVFFIDNSPKPPPKRVSLTPKSLRKIKYPYLFFINDTKLNAYRAFLDKKMEPISVPAKLLLDNNKLIVVTNLTK
jgi:6-phosphogluconolactonase